MPYEFLEEVAIADVAFRATGQSLEELLTSAADATMNAMVDDLGTIDRTTTKSIHVEDEAEDLLLVNFLQELIYYKDAERLLLRPDRLRVERHGRCLVLDAVVSGEPVNPKRHALKVDVKAVTFHRLRVEHTPRGWEAMVVLDV
ncbi:MAG TPA: archease [Candidatus Omnitrophica bacterium]|nr:MAG: hypothetical protein A2Z92_05030 [Omnitrophica WOR_2 bacterium GWA2_63_20]OGX16172.1 MAG: hypothetical protein A2105_06055 [Omnitrophica WOR_2 bacterium GWF2_63_9]OGX32100.1 MAG: hypothetical protein A3E56_03430 [Omnitrophica WOR_2 bacterium RIFCSPHIGHO2_12_FULL_64_13]OGX35151.1 MAG: hypothetical protein A3B73_02250 [Omnitrophica WOR_2 bacterium RIFCSPHIGHO2_02_FULL_63_39]OGX45565.1 MAG: hypothetical protein A3I71_01765 [Omnitrophica WOR_2 bacterium RIFCSPLOWO2_02_FULL_63_16]OGX48447.1